MVDPPIPLPARGDRRKTNLVVGERNVSLSLSLSLVTTSRGVVNRLNAVVSPATKRLTRYPRERWEMMRASLNAAGQSVTRRGSRCVFKRRLFGS